MRNIVMIILVFGAACIWACSKDRPSPGGTAAQAFANEWWVKVNDTGKVVKLSTYNTSLNLDSMWIDDLKHTDTFRCKANIDVNGLAFSSQSGKNIYTTSKPFTINITNGKIVKNGGVTKTGNIVDSIYMEVEFSTKPGVKKKIAGVARTRWDDDDY